MSKVLIIEDEMIISFGYRLQLEQMGFDVIGTARSSDEALDLLARERPDVIVMDVYIQGDLNGLELAQQIHQEDAIPVIFMTASSDPDIVDGIRALRGCHYLLKPVDTDSLAGLLYSTVRADA